jgi:hypothetical protein
MIFMIDDDECEDDSMMKMICDDEHEMIPQAQPTHPHPPPHNRRSHPIHPKKKRPKPLLLPKTRSNIPSWLSIRSPDQIPPLGPHLATFPAQKLLVRSSSDRMFPSIPGAITTASLLGSLFRWTLQKLVSTLRSLLTLFLIL